MFSKYVLFEKGHLNKRAGVWTPWPPPVSAIVLPACIACIAFSATSSVLSDVSDAKTPAGNREMEFPPRSIASTAARPANVRVVTLPILSNHDITERLKLIR